MRLNNMRFLAFVSLGMGFATMSYAGNCPPLTPSNIAQAACASETEPYQTSALASVKYHATTPCPSGGVGAKKWLQSIFKKAKTYSATEGAKTHAGKVTCTYELDEAWQKHLATDQKQLVLTASIDTAEKANYWSLPSFSKRCPDLSVSDIEQLGGKDGKIELQHKREGHELVYTFRSDLKTTLSGKMKSMFASLPKGTKLTKGRDAVVESLEVYCSYTYHPGGEEVKLEMVGTNKALIAH
jgi:hypothetical protein